MPFLDEHGVTSGKFGGAGGSTGGGKEFTLTPVASKTLPFYFSNLCTDGSYLYVVYGTAVGSGGFIAKLDINTLNEVSRVSLGQVGNVRSVQYFEGKIFITYEKSPITRIFDAEKMTFIKMLSNLNADANCVVKDPKTGKLYLSGEGKTAELDNDLNVVKTFNVGQKFGDLIKQPKNGPQFFTTNSFVYNGRIFYQDRDSLVFVGLDGSNPKTVRVDFSFYNYDERFEMYDVQLVGKKYAVISTVTPVSETLPFRLYVIDLDTEQLVLADKFHMNINEAYVYQLPREVELQPISAGVVPRDLFAVLDMWGGRLHYYDFSNYKGDSIQISTIKSPSFRTRPSCKAIHISGKHFIVYSPYIYDTHYDVKGNNSIAVYTMS